MLSAPLGRGATWASYPADSSLVPAGSAACPGGVERGGEAGNIPEGGTVTFTSRSLPLSSQSHYVLLVFLCHLQGRGRGPLGSSEGLPKKTAHGFFSLPPPHQTQVPAAAPTR